MPKTYLEKRAREKGLTIIDAKRPCYVSVNATDVRKAQEKNPENCAMARACKREQGADEAFFFRTMAYLRKGDKLIRYQLPTSVQKEIVAFDRSKSFEPGNYRLTPPSPSQTLPVKRVTEARRKRNHHHRDGDGASKRKNGAIHRTANVREAMNPNL